MPDSILPLSGFHLYRWHQIVVMAIFVSFILLVGSVFLWNSSSDISILLDSRVIISKARLKIASVTSGNLGSY